MAISKVKKLKIEICLLKQKINYALKYKNKFKNKKKKN